MKFSWKNYTLKIMTILKTFQEEPRRRRFPKENMGFIKKMDLQKEDGAREKMCFWRWTMPKEVVLKRKRTWEKDRARERM
jgi:hypothetical protein